MSFNLNSLQKSIVTFVQEWTRENDDPIAREEIILEMENQGIKPKTTANSIQSLIRKKYIRRSVDGVNIKFFSRGVLSEVEALTREEFDDIVEMSNDNLVFRAWTTPENYTILIQLSRYYRNNNIPYKRGVIIQLTEELLKNPPLSDIPEVIIRRDIPNPQFAIFGKF